MNVQHFPWSDGEMWGLEQDICTYFTALLLVITAPGLNQV